MDIRFPNGGESIEYSTLGGVIDLFFLNGPTPAQVAQQGTEIWGKPAEVPYWSLGVGLFPSAAAAHCRGDADQQFHSCKYGYIDIAEVAEVVANVSFLL